MNDFKEEYIFECEKDMPVKNCKSFKYRMFHKYGIEVSSNLYIKIINYQIKEYGCMKYRNSDWMTNEDRKRLATNKHSRERGRRKCN